MSTLDDWIAQASGSLDLPADSMTNDLRDELLDLARIAGPLTCYLVGVAVGRGADASQALASLTALVPAAEPDTAVGGKAGDAS